MMMERDGSAASKWWFIYNKIYFMSFISQKAPQ